MPLPADLVSIVVTSNRASISGAPESGVIVFDPGQPIMDAAGNLILEGPVRRQVQNGVMTPVTLPCTGQGGLNPPDFTYHVTVSVGASTHSYDIALPSTLGPSVDLSALTPVSPPPPATAFASANTWTGTQTFDGNPPLVIPAGAAAGDVLTSDAQGHASWQPGGGGGGISPPAGDIGGTAGSPAVISTHLSSPLPIAQGGTAATSAGAALTTLGAASAAALAAETSRAQAAEALKAPLASPALTGTPTAPTPAGTDSSTRLATTAFVAAAVPSSLPPSGSAGGDLGGTYPNPAVTGTHLNAPLPLAQGGTGQASQAAALTALAGTQSAGKYLRSDGTSTALASITAGDIPVLNQNTTGNAATATSLAGGVTLPAYLAPRVVTLTFGATISVDASLGNAFSLTLTASTGTIANPASPADGQVIRFRITQDATGSRTVAWGTAYDWGAGNSPPALSSGAGKVDIVAFEYVAALSKHCYLGASVPQGF